MTAKTATERKAKQRKLLALESIKEVRGILAHTADHPAVRSVARGAADKLARKRAKLAAKR